MAEEEKLDTSEDQFQALLAQIIARYGRSLGQGDSIPPMGLRLLNSGKVEVSIAVAGTPEELSSCMAAMIESLAGKVAVGDSLATSLSYLKEGENVIEVQLENHENYCAKVFIPISADTPPCCDVEAMEVHDGAVQVFPLV